MVRGLLVVVLCREPGGEGFWGEVQNHIGESVSSLLAKLFTETLMLVAGQRASETPFEEVHDKLEAPFLDTPLDALLDGMRSSRSSWKVRRSAPKRGVQASHRERVTLRFLVG
jgi:hypothetical protein